MRSNDRFGQRLFGNPKTVRPVAAVHNVTVRRSMLMGGFQQPTCIVRISMRLVPISETDFDSFVGIGAAGIEIWLHLLAIVFMVPRFD